MTLAVCPLRSESRGSIHVKSADPSVPPAIRGNFMSDPTDVAAIVAGMRIGRHIAEAAALDPYRAYEMTPGPDCASDADFEASARSTGQTLYHIVGTAKIDRKRTRLNSRHSCASRMQSSARKKKN